MLSKHRFYMGRTNHIHFKVREGGQLFLPEDFAAELIIAVDPTRTPAPVGLRRPQQSALRARKPRLERLGGLSLY